MNIGNERLLKLATHLESGKLGHEVFDFSEYNNVCKPICGTAGCAIGECPIVFPDEWKFSLSGLPLFNDYGPRGGAKSFFEINDEEADCLFFPMSPDAIRRTSSILPMDATAAQVAANIRAFVERRTGE